MANMTYDEKYDAVQAFFDKYENELDEARLAWAHNQYRDLFPLNALDDAMMDIETALVDKDLNRLTCAKSHIIDAMLHIAERWANEHEIDEEV
jgi:hypothetical protein